MKRDYSDLMGTCKFIVSDHAKQRMEERNISDEEVRLVYLFGERQPQMGEKDALYYMGLPRLNRLKKHLNLPSSLEDVNVVVMEVGSKSKKTLIKTVYRAKINAKRKKDIF